MKSRFQSIGERLSLRRASVRERTRRVRAASRCDGGQTLVEFVLVVPMFLVLFFGIVEFGSAWRKYQLLTNTAREGAREAVLQSSTKATVQTLMENRLNDTGMDATQAAIDLTHTCSVGDTRPGDPPGCTGTADTVVVQYPHQFLFLGPLIDLMCTAAGCDGTAYSTIQLTAASVMRNE